MRLKNVQLTWTYKWQHDLQNADRCLLNPASSMNDYLEKHINPMPLAEVSLPVNGLSTEVK
jgi:hypothetical protein